MLQWLAKKHAKTAKIYQLEKDAHYLDLRCIEMDLNIRNVQGLIKMAREDIEEDARELQQAETDIKNLQAALPDLQRQDTSDEKLKDLQKTLEGVESAVKSGSTPTYPGNIALLREKVRVKESIQSVHDEINTAKEKIEFCRSETNKRIEEIKNLESMVTRPAEKGGYRGIKAKCQNEARSLRTVAEEIRQKA
jgi:predicted  nucleic acid-binding Zn-ribbon protein